MFEALGATFGATLAGCLVLIGTTGAAIYFFLKRRHESERPAPRPRPTRQPILWTPPPEEIITFAEFQTIVREEAHDVCELALVRKNFESVIPVEQDKKIPLLNVHMPGTSRKMLINYSGTIVCGFDLSGLDFSHDGTSRKVKIFLPPSRALDLYADMKSIRIYHKETGVFVDDFKLEEQNTLIAAGLEDRRQQEIQDGILLHADENARKLLLSRLMNRGLNRSFELEVVTLDDGTVPALNAP